jgi:hypothetical protein
MSDQRTTRPISWIVKPTGEPIFSERAMHVTICDDASGEFVELRDGQGGKTSVEPSEWPALRAAINKAVRWCNKPEAEK